MKPGRGLDVLVAEKVMGNGTFSIGGGPDLIQEGRADGFTRTLASYSTDIAAAWEVVDSIRYNHGGGLLELYRNGDDTWAARFDEDARLSTCLTAPHAICLAALAELFLNLDQLKDKNDEP